MARRKNSNNPLVKAINYVVLSNLAMGDSIIELTEYLADEAGYEYDYYVEDAESIFVKVLEILVDKKSIIIPETLEYYFSNEDALDNIFNDFIRHSEVTSNSIMYMAIRTIYELIGDFPEGNTIQELIQTNVFDKLATNSLDAAKVGYTIGHIYWQYITRPEYGVRTNCMSAVGRKCNDNECSYYFRQQISNYYFRDNYPDDLILPYEVGYEVRFLNSSNYVVVDIYAFTWVIDYITEDGEIHSNILYSDAPRETIMITSFSESDLDDVAHQIASWLDNHIEDAIAFGVEHAD